MKRPRRTTELLIDRIAPHLLRDKPGELVPPEMAIAVGLSMVVPGPERFVSPQGPIVRMVMMAIHLAGYKIVRREGI